MASLKEFLLVRKRQKLLVTVFVTIAISLAVQISLPTSKGRETEFRALVAEHELPAGHALAPRDFRLQYHPAAQSRSAGLVSDQDTHHYLGKKLVRALKAGDFLKERDFGRKKEALSHRVPRGKRAVTLKVQAAPGISDGDRVDVFCLSRNNSVLVAEAVEVLRIGSPIGESSPAILALSPSEILQLNQKGGENARISLLLRNPSDRERHPKERGFLAKKRVEVLVE